MNNLNGAFASRPLNYSKPMILIVSMDFTRLDPSSYVRANINVGSLQSFRDSFQSEINIALLMQKDKKLANIHIVFIECTNLSHKWILFDIVMR